MGLFLCSRFICFMCRVGCMGVFRCSGCCRCCRLHLRYGCVRVYLCYVLVVVFVLSVCYGFPDVMFQWLYLVYVHCGCVLAFWFYKFHFV